MKEVSDQTKAYEVGFAEGYRGDKIKHMYPGDLAAQYMMGRADGKEHFDKVLEIVEVTGRSLPEVHRLAVNSLYEKIKDSLLG